MNDDKRRRIFERLRAANPTPTTELHYRTPFQLLVAVILSAQATDKGVNKATAELFPVAGTPEAILALGEDGLRRYIRTIGLFNSKAKNIIKTCEILIAEHGGQVPHDRDSLQALPGVGRKTANVVLGAAFDTPGIVVDTHVARVSGRLELTRHRDPAKIEIDLMRFIPRCEWSGFSLRLVFFGREVCNARKPKCPVCPLKAHCPYPRKTPVA